MADADVSRAGPNRAAKARHERLLKGAGPERLAIVRVERAESRKQLVGGRQTSIEAQAHLVNVIDLVAGGGEILKRGIRGRQRHLTKKCRRDRIDAVRGNSVLRKRNTAPACGRVANRTERRKVA